jgi:hypothetical protein
MAGKMIAALVLGIASGLAACDHEADRTERVEDEARVLSDDEFTLVAKDELDALPPGPGAILRRQQQEILELLAQLRVRRAGEADGCADAWIANAQRELEGAQALKARGNDAGAIQDAQSYLRAQMLQSFENFGAAYKRGDDAGAAAWRDDVAGIVRAQTMIEFQEALQPRVDVLASAYSYAYAIRMDYARQSLRNAAACRRGAP